MTLFTNMKNILFVYFEFFITSRLREGLKFYEFHKLLCVCVHIIKTETLSWILKL